MGVPTHPGNLATVVAGLVLGPLCASALTYHLMRRGLSEGRAVATGVILGVLLVLAILSIASDLPGWLEVIPLIGLPLVAAAYVLNLLSVRRPVAKNARGRRNGAAG